MFGIIFFVKKNNSMTDCRDTLALLDCNIFLNSKSNIGSDVHTASQALSPDYNPTHKIYFSDVFEFQTILSLKNYWSDAQKHTQPSPPPLFWWTFTVVPQYIMQIIFSDYD